MAQGQGRLTPAASGVVAALGSLALSGLASLLYEVCWIRQGSLVFGSSTLAVSTVLAVFLAGLAAGSEAGGRLSVRLARPLRVCAALEIATGLLALASPALFALAEQLYGEAYRTLGERAGLLLAARVGLTALVVLPPTVLMGATLPLFCAPFARAPGRIAARVGTLYAANTLGAALGCAATGLWLVPALGVRGTIRLGVLSSLLAAGLAWLADRAAAPLGRTVTARPAATPAALGALVFVAGFVALACEVLWTRYLGLLVHGTIRTYTLTLTVVLTGIVLGSATAARLFDGRLGTLATLGTLQGLTGVVVLVLLLLPPAAWAAIGTGLPVVFVLILAPAVLSGASFPLAIRLAAREPGTAGRHTGRLAALNVVGGIAGSLVAGFLGLPALGLRGTALLVTGASVAAGAAAWILGARPGARLRPAAAALALGLAWLAVPRLLPTRVPADFLAAGGVLVDVREGLTASVAVVRTDGIRQLQMDRWWQGQSSRNHQLVAAHLPMLLHPDPRRVVVVGIGAGQTASRFLLHPIERLDCVDVDPAVFEVLREHFDAGWMADPRVRLLAEDGRNVLAHTAARYDVVSLELGQVFRPGVEAFYTRDFYARVADRLRPGGLVAQFVPLPLLDVEQLRGVLRSFLDVFPASVLWYNTSELLLIGSREAPPVLRVARLRALETGPEIRADLRYSHWDGPAYWLERPAVLAGGFLLGPRGLAALAGDARPLRDDRPVLEYAAGEALGREPPEPVVVPLLRAELDPIESVLEPGADPALVREAAEVRELNLADLLVAARLRELERLVARGEHEAIARLLREILAQHPRHGTANRMLADALVYLRRPGEAREAYARTQVLRPDDALAHRGLGTTLLLEGDAAAGVEHLRAALVLRPEDAEARNNLGIGLARLGDLAAATREFEQAVLLRPDDADARRNLAQARAAPRRP